MKWKYVLIEIFIIVLVGISPFIYFMTISGSDSEYIEDSIIIEGLITDKKVIYEGTCKDYYFTLNESTDYQVCSCVYSKFTIGDYFYITELGRVSKDGISFEFIICDDFKYCIRKFSWDIFLFIGIPLIIILLIGSIYYLLEKNKKKGK